MPRSIPAAALVCALACTLLTPLSNGQNTDAPLVVSDISPINHFHPPNTTEQTSTVIVSGTPGGTFQMEATEPWIRVTRDSETLPATIRVTTSAAGRNLGDYQGLVRLWNAAGERFLNVGMYIYEPLTVSPTSLEHYVSLGGAAPKEFTISLGGAAVGWSVNSPERLPSWIVLLETRGVTPSQLRVRIDPTGLPAGDYVEAIRLSAQFRQEASISVRLTLREGNVITLLTANPPQLAFTWGMGDAAPAAKAVHIDGPTSRPTVQISDFVSVSSLGYRLPLDLNVSVRQESLTSLAPGEYRSTILVTADGATNNPLTIPVTLTVTRGNTSEPRFLPEPSALELEYVPGGTAPGASVRVNTANISNWSAAVDPPGHAPWLSIRNGRGSAGASFTVKTNPTGLATGTYSGQIVLSSAETPSVHVISVTLHVRSSTGTTQCDVSPASVLLQWRPGDLVPQTMVSVNHAGSGGWTVTSATPWLFVTRTDDYNFLVGATTGGLAVPGVYRGSVTVNAPSASNSPVMVPVELRLLSNDGLVVSSASFSWTMRTGDLVPASAFRLESGAPTSTAAITGGGTWVDVSPKAGSFPANINLRGTSPLPAGTWTAKLVITAPGASNSPVEIPIRVEVLSDAVVSANPASVNLSAQTGSASPTAEVRLDGEGVSTWTAKSSASWLSVEPMSGVFPATLRLRANAGLAAGHHTAAVTVLVPGASNSPLTIPVTVAVTVAPSASILPASVEWTHVAGDPAPATDIRIEGTGLGQWHATVSSGASWLSVSAASGQVPGNIGLNVRAGDLQPGDYSATLTITIPGAANSPVSVPVTLRVERRAATIQAVVDAAAFGPGPFAPGQLISVFGRSLGPADAVGLRTTTPNLLDDNLAGVRVLAAGRALPLLFVQAGQINAVLPLDIGVGDRWELAVEKDGEVIARGNLAVGASAPRLFAADSTGKGPGAILNQNMSANSAANPAERGSVVVLYGSGGGLYDCSFRNGEVTGSSLGRVQLPVWVEIDGQPARVEYAGSAPGIVAGVIQVNARVPETVRSGDVPVKLLIGTAASQEGVTVAIR